MVRDAGDGVGQPCERIDGVDLGRFDQRVIDIDVMTELSDRYAVSLTAAILKWMTRPNRRLRCATYTRKSSEEGLDMEFNSLDAQREVSGAYN